MKNILVVGAGTMGAGIAQIAAESGYHVVLYDLEREYVDRAIRKIEKNLKKAVEKQKITQNQEKETMRRITASTNMAENTDIDLMIEAVTENMRVKKEVLAQIKGLFSEDMLIASNTSALSITEFASEAARPDRCIGLHFFNPVGSMKLVEIIRGLQTSEKTFCEARQFVESIARTGICAKESPGFVVNRMLVPYINEAAYILSEGIAAAKDIDEAMKLGANHPMGPLALADMIGVDVCYFVMKTLHTDFGDDKYRPCPLLKKMVDAGYLGRKAGKGFFEYPPEK